MLPISCSHQSFHPDNQCRSLSNCPTMSVAPITTKHIRRLAQQIGSPPPQYTRVDSACMRSMDALRIALVILLMDSVFRTTNSGSNLIRKAPNSLHSILSLTLGLFGLPFAMWGLYTSTLLRCSRRSLNCFVVAFGFYSLLMLVVLCTGVLATVKVANDQYLECALQPIMFGIGYTLEDARQRCMQRVTGSKFVGVLLQGLRLDFQLLLVYVIYAFRRDMLAEQAETLSMTDDNEQGITFCGPEDAEQACPEYSRVARPYEMSVFQSGTACRPAR